MKNEIDRYNILKKITTVFIYAMFTIFILYPGTNGYSGMFDAKFHMFCFICGGYALIMLTTLLELVAIGHIKFEPIKVLKNMGIVQKSAIAYLIFTWLSALMSPYFPDTLIGVSRYEGAITISIYCLVSGFASYFGKISKQMIYVFAGTVTIFSIICILQLNGLNPFTFYPEGYTYYDAYTAYNGQFLGTIGNTDTVAAFLCIVIPMLWLSILRLTDRKRFFIILPLILSVYVLLKMWVLAGVVGVVVGGFIALPFSLKLTSNQKKATIAIILTLLLICLIGIYFSDANNGFIYEAKEILHGNIDGTFGSGRIFIWQEVIQNVSKYFWFGSGPDTMLKANIQPFVRYDDALQGSIIAQIDVAHNEYLNILYHQGIFALIAYITLIISVLALWIRKGNGNRYSCILGSVIVCYLIQAFFGFSSCIVSPLFWLAMALIVGKQNAEEDVYV